MKYIMILHAVVFCTLLFSIREVKHDDTKFLATTAFYSPSLAFNLLFGVESFIIFLLQYLVDIKFSNDSDVLSGISKLDNLVVVSRYQVCKTHYRRTEATSFKEKVDELASHESRLSSDVII